MVEHALLLRKNAYCARRPVHFDMRGPPAWSRALPGESGKKGKVSSATLLLTNTLECKFTVYWQWVKGPTGSRGNEKADRRRSVEGTGVDMNTNRLNFFATYHTLKHCLAPTTLAITVDTLHNFRLARRLKNSQNPKCVHAYTEITKTHEEGNVIGSSHKLWTILMGTPQLRGRREGFRQSFRNPGVDQSYMEVKPLGQR